MVRALQIEDAQQWFEAASMLCQFVADGPRERVSTRPEHDPLTVSGNRSRLHTKNYWRVMAGVEVQYDGASFSPIAHGDSWQNPLVFNERALYSLGSGMITRENKFISDIW